MKNEFFFGFTDCTYNETAGGNITSPLFPNKYPTGVSCTWVLEAPVNHTVKLRIEEFQLEKDKKCFYDYMEFFDGVNATEDHQLNKRRCGKQDSFTIESTGQKLLVKFTSDKSETYKGFRAVWETKEISKTIFFNLNFITCCEFNVTIISWYPDITNPEIYERTAPIQRTTVFRPTIARCSYEQGSGYCLSLTSHCCLSLSRFLV